MDATEDNDVAEEEDTVVGVGAGDKDEAVFAFEDGVDNDDDEEVEKDDSPCGFLDEAAYFGSGSEGVD